MTSAPAPAASRPDRLLGAALLLVALGAGGWLWTRPAAAPSRSAPATVSIDARLPLAVDGAGAVRLRIVRPCVLDVTVDAPAGTELAFGPGRPVEIVPVDAPDPAQTIRWVLGAAAPEVRAFAAGMYVLRVQAPAGTAAARVRVGERPWRGAPGAAR